MGPAGEKLFGRGHFLDLLSAFASPLVLTARHGATELGYVDPLAVQPQKDRPTVLLLGGRSRKVTAVDWSKRSVAVEPTADKGKSRWLASSRWLGFEVCQAMRRVLLRQGDAQLGLSKRGSVQLDEVRELLTAAERQGSLLLEHLPSGRLRWWTFAGAAVNSALALRVGDSGSVRVADLWLETASAVSVLALMRGPARPLSHFAFAEDLAKRADLKFSGCLPAALVASVMVARSLDEAKLQRLS